MSWLNFNESLNSLKGQISNFASNVLADEEEGLEITGKDYEELKNICVQQEIEINKLKSINEELRKQHVQQKNVNDVTHTEEIWNWNVKDLQNVNNTTADLRKQIDVLENEKKDLIGQLEQLDIENQQNLSKIVGLKDKLQEENEDLKENYFKIQEQHNTIVTREQKLNTELKELQTKFKEIQKSENENQYREKYEVLLGESQRLKSELQESKKENNVLKSSNSTLQKILEDYKISSEQETSNNIEKIKQLENENKIVYTELHKAKEDIQQYEKKRSEDAENCEKLAFILDSYDKQVGSLKKELEEKEAKLLISVTNDKILKKLKEEIDTINKVHQSEIISLNKDLANLKDINRNLQEANENLTREHLEKIEELESDAKNQEIQIQFLTEELSTIKSENSVTINEEYMKLKKELDRLQKEQENVLLQLHNKYVNIITENIKKFQDCDTPSDFQHCSHDDDPQILEFNKQVENILKILLDFKCKCEILEKKVYDLSQEKTKILTEKNHEIERLIQNSEILSQEVITKTQTIKDYENECNELAKNNELLINELDNYKNSSGLQTISESNEDNMVLLESQLENANKRIEDLEKIIDDFERQQKEKSYMTSENRLENAMVQLSITEKEINKRKTEYQDLLSSFDQLQIEYDTLKYDFDLAKDHNRFVNEENIELKSNLDKAKSDYENTEYQLSEVNIHLDGLKEEIEVYRKKIDTLIAENNKLQMLNDESIRNNEDIMTELNIVKEKLLEEEDNRKITENQVRHLTEKLQNAKMVETSLKLQYDTVSKEVVALSEVKYNLEVTLNKTNHDLAQFQNDFLLIQTQNEKLIKDYENLQKTTLEREEQIKNFEEFVTELQTKLEKYEKLAVDENEELLKKLTVSDTTEILQELKSQIAKYESLAVEENEQLLKSLHITENSDQPHNVEIKENSQEYIELKQQFATVMEERNNLIMELNKQSQIQILYKEALEKEALLEQQLKEITNSRNELINIVTTKHQESVVYHNEIQRLSQILTKETEKCKNLEMQLNHLQTAASSIEEIESKNQEVEKLIDQNNFLKEKCEVMAKNLLEEQSKIQRLLAEKSNPSEKELVLQKNLDRLQTHLIELEEHYTQELLQAEQKNTELQAKVNEIEEREKSSSTMYTSVSIRANQQVESLQNQLQTVVTERDGLRKRISDAEDQNSKQAAALANLQFVLEQFQKDKEKDVFKETERIRRQINAEKQIQEDLKKEILGLKSQLEESKQGLQAASRLSDQLEYSKKLVGTLKEEVSQLQEKLTKSEEKLKNVTSQTDGKVDKSLIKNLVIGFVTSNNNLNKDQLQILKIIATVLDFNQQDHDKVNLNKQQQGSWLSSFLNPQPGTQNVSHESLSQAFIKFLENESKPRIVPSLLNASEPTKSTTSSKSSTPRQSPIVLSEIVLPTFADFAQNRNSSAILKDVLKDNS